MTTHYGDYHGYVTSTASAYPISYSGAGLFDMSPLAEEMMDLLPSYFFLGNNNRRIMELIAVILFKYENRIDEVRDQFFVETATWGLVYWEELVGLPVDGDNLDYESRRNAILNKLRDCSTEKCFVEGIEGIIKGQAIVIDLDPATNRYQINIELKSQDITFKGPSSSPAAAATGVGLLNGDYTYRVTYEFEPIPIPDYLTLFPYTNFSGLFDSTSVLSQRQFVIVTGTGNFDIGIGGLIATAGPLNELSTAQDVVDILNPLLLTTYGIDAVSTPFPTNVVGSEGVILVFDGPYTRGLSLPLLEVTGLAPGSIVGSEFIVNNPEFIQPDVTGETPSGISPTSVTEVQTLGSGLFDPATAFRPFEGDLIATATASMSAAVIYASAPTTTTSAAEITTFVPYVDTSTPLEEVGDGHLIATATATLTANVEYHSAVMTATATATATLPTLVLNPPTPPLVFTPVTGGTYAIRVNTVWDITFPPIFEMTAPIPYDATPAQITAALEALPSVYPGSIIVYGGPLPTVPVTIEWVGVEKGFPQPLLEVETINLVGGFYEVIRNRAGHTSYSGSESNTVTAVNNSILLTSVPKSPEGASRRNIYRKKTQAPYNEWRYVGSINDNYNPIFLDNVPDSSLSEIQHLVIFGAGTFKLRFDSIDTVTLSNTSNQVAVEAAIDAVITGSYPDVDVTAVGASPSFTDGGMVITFDGGDVVGKDVPKMEVVLPNGVTGYVVTTGPRRLTEKNTAFTYTFQRVLEYIYVTKPAHLRIRELRSAGFRASINSAGDPV